MLGWFPAMNWKARTANISLTVHQNGVQAVTRGSGRDLKLLRRPCGNNINDVQSPTHLPFLLLRLITPASTFWARVYVVLNCTLHRGRKLDVVGDVSVTASHIGDRGILARRQGRGHGGLPFPCSGRGTGRLGGRVGGGC